MLEGFLALLRAGLNVDEPKGTSVPGRELLPMELDEEQTIPSGPERRAARRPGRHRYVPPLPTSLVRPEIAKIAPERRSSLPLWPGGAR